MSRKRIAIHMILADGDREAFLSCQKAVRRVIKKPTLDFEVGFFAVAGLVDAHRSVVSENKELRRALKKVNQT